MQLGHTFFKSRKLAVAFALGASATWATAGYFQWETVELPTSSGAACGDGTPYRFFVNRTFLTKDTVVSFEGGGGCWEQDTCLGKAPLGATNPNGIPSNYMTSATMAALGLVTPFTSRINPLQTTRTQAWNMVYLPYCTGDTHTGSAVRVYGDSNPASPRVQYHKGYINAQVAAQWIRNNMGRPKQLLVTGFSAGGVGATSNYAVMRNTLAPTGRSSLLGDSGPLFPAPQGGSAAQYPSLPLQNKIRSAWGADEAGGIVSGLRNTLPAFDTRNLGSIYGSLALRYPADKFGYAMFQRDGVFPAFSYRGFQDDVKNAPDAATAEARMNAHWRKDISQWIPTISNYANISYHVPYMRDFGKSHCLSVVDFSGTEIDGSGPNMAAFVKDNLDGGPGMRHQAVTTIEGHRSIAVSLLSWAMALFQ